MDAVRRWRVVFRRWRRTRPFWGGALLLIGAGIILSVPTIGGTTGATFTEGIAGVSGVLIALLMGVSGLTMWVSPAARVFAGVAGCFLSLVAVVASNLGGFLFGTIFGIVGAAMAIAWTPTTVAEQKADTAPDGPGTEPTFAYAGVGAREEVSGVAGSPVSGSGLAPSAAAPARATTARTTSGDDLFEPFPDASFSAPTHAVATPRDSQALEGEVVPDELFPPVPGAGADQPGSGESRHRWGVGGE